MSKRAKQLTTAIKHKIQEKYPHFNVLIAKSNKFKSKNIICIIITTDTDSELHKVLESICIEFKKFEAYLEYDYMQYIYFDKIAYHIKLDDLLKEFPIECNSIFL